MDAMSDGSLSKGTCSSRNAQSPVSLRYAATPRISHRGSSLNPSPTSALPRLVSGWYWCQAPPSARCVEATSNRRCRARAGHLVHAAQEVLAGVPEPDPAADAALEVARAARHVAGDHALVLVPRCSPCGPASRPRISTVKRERRSGPVARPALRSSPRHLGIRVEARHERLARGSCSRPRSRSTSPPRGFST